MKKFISKLIRCQNYHSQNHLENYGVKERGI